MQTLIENLNLYFPFWVYLVASAITAFIVAYISIPTIVLISEFKNLFDFPDERKCHKKATPVLGGLAIFAGFTLAVIIFSPPEESGFIKYVLGGIITIMIIGLKDDILIIHPMTKLLGQFAASLIIVVIGDIRITEFHNVLGIGHLPYLWSVIFSVLLLTFFVISFNFIDGVDGLASGFAIIAACFYGFWFVAGDQFTSAIVSFSLAGSLIAFFRFNVFSKKNKIFLGDTGAMIVGFLIGVLTIRFLEFQFTAPPNIKVGSAPLVAFGLLFIPVFDAWRIFFIRLSEKDLFKSGKNHIHHRILDLGLSHLMTTLTLLGANLILFIIVLLLQPMGSVFLIAFFLLMAAALFVLLHLLKRRDHAVGN